MSLDLRIMPFLNGSFFACDLFETGSERNAHLHYMTFFLSCDVFAVDGSADAAAITTSMLMSPGDFSASPTGCCHVDGINALVLSICYAPGAFSFII